MKTSQSGILLIKGFEGFRSKPYRDQVGVPTIGYGTTEYPNGKSVTMSDKPVTEQQATDLLTNDLKQREQKVSSYVQKTINQNQFDSLIDFCYNLGTGALKQSHLLLKLNSNPTDPTIKDEFLKWDYAGGKVLSDLRMRRKKEADLYFK